MRSKASRTSPSRSVGSRRAAADTGSSAILRWRGSIANTPIMPIAPDATVSRAHDRQACVPFAPSTRPAAPVATLRAGARATVWVCGDQSNPKVDWAPPAPGRP